MEKIDFENILKITKKLINNEFVLNDLDNEIMQILGTNESLFDDITSAINNNSYSYFLDDEHNFIISWDMLKIQDNSHLNDLVRVTDIFIY